MTESRPPAPTPTDDERVLDAIQTAQRTRADLAVSVAIDGIALIDSASVEHASHEVRVVDGRAVSCSCWPFRRYGRPCPHRAYVAIRLWELAMGADLSQVPARALVASLRNGYLDGARPRLRAPWLHTDTGPETPHDRPVAVGEFTGPAPTQ